MDGKELNKNMETICGRARFMAKQGEDHCEICNTLADEFDLLEAYDRGWRLPLWLMYVVSGIMRED